MGEVPAEYIFENDVHEAVARGSLAKFLSFSDSVVNVRSVVVERASQISFRLMMSLLVGVDSLPCMICSNLIDSVGGPSLPWLVSFAWISSSMAFLRFVDFSSSSGVCGLTLVQPLPGSAVVMF